MLRAVSSTACLPLARGVCWHTGRVQPHVRVAAAAVAAVAAVVLLVVVVVFSVC